jgi:hypothetical protein
LLRILNILLLVLLTASILQAQDKKKPKHLEDHYHLSLFAGFSTDLKGNAGYKLGIEYEYRLNKRMGVGGTFDFTGKDFKIFSFSVGADFYLFKFPLILGAGLGAKNQGSKWKPFVRGIAVYDFHIGKISLGPIVMYDIYFDNKDIISPGITFGISL